MEPPMMQPPMMQPPMMQPPMMQPSVAHGQQQPLLYGMQTPPMPGYEGIGGGFVPPPPIQPMPTPESQPAQDWSIPALSKETAKRVFCSYVDSKCCYSSGPATDGVITNIEPFNTYRYRLETYTESRKTEWATKPYDGQPLTSVIQPVPNLWEIQVKVPTMFTNSSQEVEVPNVSIDKMCETCSASGQCQCAKCGGATNEKCSMCRGSGKNSDEQTCGSCNGNGTIMCTQCKGAGLIKCDTCKGKKKLLMYIKLTVEWINNSDDFVSGAVEQSSGLDKNKLSEVNGKTLFKDTNFMVYALNGFPERSVADASVKMVSEHYKKFSQTSRILQQ
ncbi:protein SSUH2 isoform X2, partial [Clarias magur]